HADRGRRSNPSAIAFLLRTGRRIPGQSRFDNRAGTGKAEPMRFRECGRLNSLGEVANDPLRYGDGSPRVLGEDQRHGRLDVDDADPGVIVGEHVNPPPPRLPHNVRGVEAERTPRPQVGPTPFSCGLDDFTLVVARVDTEFATKVVERDNRYIR